MRRDDQTGAIPLSANSFTACALRELRQPHAAQHMRRLGEPDVFVANDVDAVSPPIEEIQEVA
jgi:hypothetical protein